MSQPSTTIHLLPQEELSSLLTRLADNSADHITLVLPDKSIVAQGLISLQLLADEANKMGKQLTISSDSAQIERIAKRVGLSIAGSGEGLPEHGFMAGADVAALAVGLPDYSLDQPGQESTPTKPATTEPDPVPIVPIVTETMPSPVEQYASLSQANRDSLWSRLGKRGWAWGAIAAVVVILLVGGLLAINYYVPKATVTVFAEQKTLDRDVQIVADPNATSANVKTLTVPATQVDATASKTQTFPATGKKDIGTKATGTVTVYNKTNTDKTLAAGTIVTSAGLQFLLNQAVLVEAATIETTVDPITLKSTTSTTPGTADVAVTSGAIGDDYNLEANSSFTVAKFDSSSFSARNTAAFSGGTKKSVKMVTADDQSEALDSLDSGLADEATKALQVKVTAGMELLKETVKQDVSSKDYSQKVGDQADEFSLTVEVSATGLSVNPKDIQTMLDTEVATKVPDGYSLDTDNATIENHVISTGDDGAVQLTSNYTALVIPDVDVAGMRKAIAGKKPTVVEEYLKSQPNLHGYDIVITPKLPGPFYHLPNLTSHITIKVEVKKP